MKHNKDVGLSEQEIHKILRQTRRRKNHTVVDYYTSGGKEPFEIKNFIPVKGKNSLNVSKAFAEIIYRGHQPGYFHESRMKQIEKGPRFGALGKPFK